MKKSAKEIRTDNFIKRVQQTIINLENSGKLKRRSK